MAETSFAQQTEISPVHAKFRDEYKWAIDLLGRNFGAENVETGVFGQGHSFLVSIKRGERSRGFLLERNTLHRTDLPESLRGEYNLNRSKDKHYELSKYFSAAFNIDSVDWKD